MAEAFLRDAKLAAQPDAAIDALLNGAIGSASTNTRSPTTGAPPPRNQPAFLAGRLPFPTNLRAGLRCVVVGLKLHSPAI